MSPFGVSEGDVCNRDGCEGVMWIPSPQCAPNAIVCKECGADPFEDDYVSPEA